ncbi:MAG: saccharopine dehydrogenase, partial [Pseudomonadota bacterium]
AGYVGAAIALKCWAAQRKGGLCGSVRAYSDADTLESQISDALAAVLGEPPIALVVGAAGRVGTGATELCDAVGVSVNRWDLAETAHGGPFPEILDHDLFLNCVLAGPDTPVFVPSDTSTRDRRLAVIGDISCDPESDYSPIKVYDRVTNWDSPALRVHQNPPLDVTAIDNLPSLLPTESSIDFAGQMLPSLSQLASLDAGVWARAKAAFDAAMARG